MWQTDVNQVTSLYIKVTHFNCLNCFVSITKHVGALISWCQKDQWRAWVAQGIEGDLVVIFSYMQNFEKLYWSRLFSPFLRQQRIPSLPPFYFMVILVNNYHPSTLCAFSSGPFKMDKSWRWYCSEISFWGITRMVVSLRQIQSNSVSSSFFFKFFHGNYI